MKVTADNTKVGDKVVLNDSGKIYIGNDSSVTRENFKRITHGIVIDSNPNKSYIAVKWIDYKGIVMYHDWYIYRIYLDLYEQ